MVHFRIVYHLLIPKHRRRRHSGWRCSSWKFRRIGNPNEPEERPVGNCNSIHMRCTYIYLHSPMSFRHLIIHCLLPEAPRARASFLSDRLERLGAPLPSVAALQESEYLSNNVLIGVTSRSSKKRAPKTMHLRTQTTASGEGGFCSGEASLWSLRWAAWS